MATTNNLNLSLPPRGGVISADELADNFEKIDAFAKIINDFMYLINIHVIDIGDYTTITADMLQSLLPPATTQLGGFNIIKVHGRYKNIGTLLFVGIMNDKSGNSGAYGSGQYLSYYMGSTDITQVTLEGGDWVIR